MRLTDAYNRNIDYLRVSITDRCNLRCRYCMPHDLPLIPHDNVMRFEELLRVCSLLAKLGVRCIRITGGEPLVRRGCLGFLRELKAISGIERVTLTTNGVLLGDALHDLSAMGIDGVNISVDTLDRETYKNLTGSDALPQVLSSLEAAAGLGMAVKVNCVPMRGVNDDKLSQIACIAKDMPVDVRFIELMPTEFTSAFSFIPTSEIVEKLAFSFPGLAPDSVVHGNGPAVYYKSPELKGSIGFISAISNHFCSSCNRIRLTSEGFLKLCLYHDDGLGLRDMLRSSATDEQITSAIQECLGAKPEKHFFNSDAKGGIAKMSRIGG